MHDQGISGQTGIMSTFPSNRLRRAGSWPTRLMDFLANNNAGRKNGATMDIANPQEELLLIATTGYLLADPSCLWE